jgi:putative transposase
MVSRIVLRQRHARDWTTRDPNHLYRDVVVAIDPDRGLNNGQPSGVATWLHSAHKKALRLWEPKPERVRFVWILSTNASWLNLTEAWFSVLERTALHNTYLRTTTEIEAHLLRGIAYLNEHPKPYRWTKSTNA